MKYTQPRVLKIGGSSEVGSITLISETEEIAENVEGFLHAHAEVCRQGNKTEVCKLGGREPV